MNMGGKIATDLEIRKLKRLYKKGYSALEIAYNINRPISFVKKYIKKIENKKTFFIPIKINLPQR